MNVNILYIKCNHIIYLNYILLFFNFNYIDILKLNNKIYGFRLLNIEPSKRLKTIMYNYHVFNKTLEDVSFEKLGKSRTDDLETEVPYEIYIETIDDKSLNLKVIY